MSTIAENLERIQSAKSDIRTAIINQGVDVPESDRIETYAEKIGSIDTRIHTSYGLCFAKFLSYDEDMQREILNNIVWDSSEVDGLFTNIFDSGGGTIKMDNLTFDFQGITSAKSFFANASGSIASSMGNASLVINNVNQYCDLSNFLAKTGAVHSLTINGTGSINAYSMLNDSRINDVTIACDMRYITAATFMYCKAKTISDLNISHSGYINYPFREMLYLEQMGDIYAPNVEVTNLFYICGQLKDVGLITIKECSYEVFYRTNAVENLVGVVTEEGNLRLANLSNLTDESVQSILEHLPNRTVASTIYLDNSIVAKLTDEQIAIATDKGWTIA